TDDHRHRGETHGRASQKPAPRFFASISLGIDWNNIKRIAVIIPEYSKFAVRKRNVYSTLGVCLIASRVGMQTRRVTNIALEFVAFAVPGCFQCDGVAKRPVGIEYDRH